MIFGATALASVALAADLGGTFADGGNTQVSAMMVSNRWMYRLVLSDLICLFFAL